MIGQDNDAKEVKKTLKITHSQAIVSRLFLFKTKARRTFVLVFFGFLLYCLAWVFSEPLGLFIDDPAQFIYAAGAARGQILQPEVSAYGIKADSPLFAEIIPNSFNWINFQRAVFLSDSFSGFKHGVTMRNSTFYTWGNPNQDVVAGTYVGQFEPIYYTLVGLPSLVNHYIPGFYAMRIVSAILNSVFLTIGFMAIYNLERFRKILLVGFFLALTPETFFMSGLVNDNGPEITAGLASWAIGVAACLESDEEKRNKLISYFLIMLTIFTTVRPYSPLYAGICFLTVVALSGIKNIKSVIFRSKAKLGLLIVWIISAFANVFWVLLRGLASVWGGYQPQFNTLGKFMGVPYVDLSFPWRVVASMSRFIYYCDLAVDEFNAAQSPFGLMNLWLYMVFGLIFVALITSKFRGAITLTGLCLVSWLSASVAEAITGRSLGYWWTGRYSLPLVVGIPLVSAYLLCVNRDTFVANKIYGSLRKKSYVWNYRYILLLAVIVTTSILHFVMFYSALKVADVGTAGPTFFIFYNKQGWQPPGTARLWIIVLFLELFFFSVALIRALYSRASWHKKANFLKTNLLLEK